MSVPVRLLTALLAVSFAASSSSAAEKLRMKFREGESYTYRLRQETNVAANIEGQEIKYGMDQQLDLTTLIKSVDADGNAKAEQTIGRVKMKMAIPPPISRTVEVDTASDEKPTDPGAAAIAANLSQMVGEAVTLTIAPDGKITDVVVPEKIKAAQQTSGGGGGDGIEQTIKQSGLRLPDGEISKGQTWDQQAEAQLPFGKMKIATTYTYNGKTKDGLHLIDAAMDMTLQPAENSPVKSLTAKEATGTFLFDNEAGRLTKSDVIQVLDLDLGNLGKQLATTKTTMTLTDDKTKPVPANSNSKDK